MRTSSKTRSKNNIELDQGFFKTGKDNTNTVLLEENRFIYRAFRKLIHVDCTRYRGFQSIAEQQCHNGCLYLLVLNWILPGFPKSMTIFLFKCCELFS